MRKPLVFACLVLLIFGITSTANAVPIADADGPYMTWVGVPVTFDGSGSYDSEGLSLTYQWDLDMDESYDDGTEPVVTYLNPLWEAGLDYFLRLGVRNSDRIFAWDQTVITILEGSPPESAPVPEPATIVLFGTGLGILVGIGRKKVKRK